MCRSQQPAGFDGQYVYAVSGYGFGLGLALGHDRGFAVTHSASITHHQSNIHPIVVIGHHPGTAQHVRGAHR